MITPFLHPNINGAGIVEKIHEFSPPVSGFRSPVSIFLLSFLLFACAPTFEQSNIQTLKNSNDMSFTITVPGGAVQLSGNPIYITGTTSTTGKTNHRLLCRVTCTDGAIPGGPWIDSKPPATGAATFDIHALVDADFDFTIDQTTAKVIAHDLMAADITAEIGETYIDTDGSQVTTWGGAGVTEAISVLKGGLSQIEYSRLFADGSSFYEEYLHIPKFLTKGSRNVTQPRTSWLKLWTIPNENDTYTISVHAYYSDLSDVLEQHTQAVLPTKVYEINTNLDCWTGIPATNNGFPLLTYLFSVNNHEWIDLIWITPDPNYYASINEFYYANQLGGADLLVCTGELKERPTTEGEMWMRPQSLTPDMTFGTKVSGRKIISRKFTCNTGFKSLAERQVLIELFASQKVFWKTDRFGVPEAAEWGMVPVIISPASFEIDTTSDDLIPIEFEFEIAHYDKFI